MQKKEAINLMPFQWDAFNADHFIQKEFLRLRDVFNLKMAVELGTCLGSSSLWMAKNYERVVTIEINKQFAEVAKERFDRENMQNIELIVGDTVQVLPTVIGRIGNDSIWLADSHWYSHCPLLDELRIIATAGIKPVIAIHDFLIPDEPELGYDSYGGQPFNFEWIKPSIEAIYGVDGYDYYYNSAEKSAGAKRGIIYLTPKV